MLSVWPEGAVALETSGGPCDNSGDPLAVTGSPLSTGEASDVRSRMLSQGWTVAKNDRLTIRRDGITMHAYFADPDRELVIETEG